MITRYGIHKLLKIGVYTLITLAVLGYAFFATSDFIKGPSITIREPLNGSLFTEPNISIKGTVERIQVITLNGMEITIDDHGNFNESVLLAPGYNVFEMVASDKFGRSESVRLELVYAVN